MESYIDEVRSGFRYFGIGVTVRTSKFPNS